MDDLISKHDVIECVYKALRTPPLEGGFTDTMSLAIGMVNDLPPAQLERKKGFWEWVDDMDYRCSVCHKYVYGCLGEVLSGHYKFCPYCGCAMEGGEDDAEEIL